MRYAKLRWSISDAPLLGASAEQLLSAVRLRDCREILGRAGSLKKTALPCYGKAVGHLTRIISPPMDTIKGVALIATFIGFLTIFAMWVSLWDNVWRVAVEPC